MTEAMILSRMVSKIVLVEMVPQLTATRVLQDRIAEDPKIEVKTGTRIEAIRGGEQVESLDVVDIASKGKSSLKADGVLVHIGIEPNTAYLKGAVPLNAKGQVIVNASMETEVPGIFAAGDIRSSSAWQISTAVGDGATAAISLQRYLNRR